MVESSRPRLVVLYGGRSAEHEVSCVSALHVTSAVDCRRYDLELVGITTDGRWVDTTAATRLARADLQALPSPDRVLAEHPEALADALATLSGPPSSADPSSPADRPPLVVLPLVHGPMGEDGTIQGLLELAGIPYCGAGVAGSAAAMDKGLTKALLSSAGLPQARYLYRHESDIDEDFAQTVERELGWPVFVKPANMGSSIGITRVGGRDGLDEALRTAARYDSSLVVEEAVEGARELEMGVLGWPDLRTSVPGEIRPSRDFYDFADKYLEGRAELEIPARVPDDVAAEMSRLAVAACRATRVDSMARVDFFYAPGRGLLINEINTIPGFTPISMYPRMWAASGLPYTELIDTLVAQAGARWARRQRFETGR